jgi:hypothetical protein
MYDIIYDILYHIIYHVMSYYITYYIICHIIPIISYHKSYHIISYYIMYHVMLCLIWEVRAVPRLCELYPGICLTTEEKQTKTSVRRLAKFSGYKKLNMAFSFLGCLVYKLCRCGALYGVIMNVILLPCSHTETFASRSEIVTAVGDVALYFRRECCH